MPARVRHYLSRSMLLRPAVGGLYCEAGDFYIDPWQPVDRAVITHAHGDHARWGSAATSAPAKAKRVLRTRLGPDATIRAVDCGEPVDVNGVRVSLHPAGHILGSAQVRVEHAARCGSSRATTRPEPDPTCTPFEPVRCHTFITESTFGLPIYRWPTERDVFADIRAWWRANRDDGRASVLFALRTRQGAAAARRTGRRRHRPVYTHGAVERLNRDYRAAGVRLADDALRERPAARGRASRAVSSSRRRPPREARGCAASATCRPAFASGWMRIRGARRRRSLDRGFVLSDHVDWPSLLARDRRHRRGARLGDARLSRAARALAHRARARAHRASRARGKARRTPIPVEVARRGGPRVKRFAQLFTRDRRDDAHDARRSTRWSSTFASTDPRDAAWAVYFLSGGRPKRLIPVRRLATWAMEAGRRSGLAVRRSRTKPSAISPRRSSLLLPAGDDASDTPLARVGRRTAAAARERSPKTQQRATMLARVARHSTAPSGSSGTS